MEKIRSEYSNSHALVIGINAYSKGSPLEYAVSDATSVAKTLTENFGFPNENVRLLTDRAATRDAIHHAFLEFAIEGTDANDRLMFFFAGHGSTVPTHNGEIGYLVPHDGDRSSLSTLIRWDELTRNAELIAAKHILFVMDACYGGLAITRSLQPGSMRFVKDMLLRRSRQVITAGKANEVVADSGGPRPNHSVFTGHFLDALDGAAETSKGLITANGVMAHVYNSVACDSISEQTPHYGQVAGDGDFLFSIPPEISADSDTDTDNDILISVPSVATAQVEMTIIEQAKEYVADERQRIRLHDLVAQETRNVLSVTGSEHFPLSGGFSAEAFGERVKKYEEVTADLTNIQAIMGYWSDDIHSNVLTLPEKGIAGQITFPGGEGVWSRLRWYPVLLLTYYGGIAAIAAGRYSNLKHLLLSPTPESGDRQRAGNIAVAMNRELTNLKDPFNSLPGLDRKRFPQSEYLFKELQPPLDDLLFLGAEYESCFDRFEIFLALIQLFYGRYGPPLGRFAWKYKRDESDSSLYKLLAEAETFGEKWAPFQAGLFNGSPEQFKVIADRLVSVVQSLDR